MKIKNVLIAGTLLVSALTFAQKDELKALKKIFTKEVPTASDLAEYKTNLAKLETLATLESDKVALNYYKSVMPKIELSLLGADPKPELLQKVLSPKAVADYVNTTNATLEFEKKSGKKVFTDDINKNMPLIKPVMVNAAAALGEAKKYPESADILYSVYLMDKTDQEKLYYAASYAVIGKEYDKALTYYNMLKDLNYSGEATMYFATNKETKKEDYFGTTPTERDLMVKAGQYEKPRQEKLLSKKGEIYKNIALILVEQGKVAEAKAAISDARKTNPDDVSLIISEAEFYLKEKDFDSYSRLVNEALAKDPNNKQLIFNLGAVSGNSNKNEEAEKYYKRAIELDSNYFDAYLNLAELKLRSDKELVEQMTKLGTSDADNKKFEALRAKQIANYKEVLPYLEKAVEIKPSDADVKKVLLGVYQALEMTDKYKALKAKM